MSEVESGNIHPVVLQPIANLADASSLSDIGGQPLSEEVADIASQLLAKQPTEGAVHPIPSLPRHFGSDDDASKEPNGGRTFNEDHGVITESSIVHASLIPTVTNEESLVEEGGTTNLPENAPIDTEDVPPQGSPPVVTEVRELVDQSVPSANQGEVSVQDTDYHLVDELCSDSATLEYIDYRFEAVTGEVPGEDLLTNVPSSGPQERADVENHPSSISDSFATSAALVEPLKDEILPVTAEFLQYEARSDGEEVNEGQETTAMGHLSDSHVQDIPPTYAVEEGMLLSEDVTLPIDNAAESQDPANDIESVQEVELPVLQDERNGSPHLILDNSARDLNVEADVAVAVSAGYHTTNTIPSVVEDVIISETQTLGAEATLPVDNDASLVVSEVGESTAGATVIAAQMEDPTICSVVCEEGEVEITNESFVSGSEELFVKSEGEIIIADTPDTSAVGDRNIMSATSPAPEAEKDISTVETQTLDATGTLGDEATSTVAGDSETITIASQLEDRSAQGAGDVGITSESGPEGPAELVVLEDEIVVTVADSPDAPVQPADRDTVSATPSAFEVGEIISTVETETFDTATLEEEADTVENLSTSEAIFSTQSEDPTIYSVIRESEDVEIEKLITSDSEELVVKPEDELVTIAVEAEVDVFDDTMDIIPDSGKQFPSNQGRTLETKATLTAEYETRFSVTEAEGDPSAAEMTVVSTQLEDPATFSVIGEVADVGVSKELEAYDSEDHVGEPSEEMVMITADMPDVERGEEVERLPSGSEPLSETTIVQAEVFFTDLETPTVAPAIESKISTGDLTHAVDGGIVPLSLTTPDEMLEAVPNHSNREEYSAVEEPPPGGVSEVADLVVCVEVESGVVEVASSEHEVISEAQVPKPDASHAVDDGPAAVSLASQSEGPTAEADTPGIDDEVLAMAETATVTTVTSTQVEAPEVSFLVHESQEAEVSINESATGHSEEGMAEIMTVNADIPEVAAIDGESFHVEEEDSVARALADVESYQNIPILEEDSQVASLETEKLDLSIEDEISEPSGVFAHAPFPTQNASLDVTDNSAILDDFSAINKASSDDLETGGNKPEAAELVVVAEAQSDRDNAALPSQKLETPVFGTITTSTIALAVTMDTSAVVISNETANTVELEGKPLHTEEDQADHSSLEVPPSQADIHDAELVVAVLPAEASQVNTQLTAEDQTPAATIDDLGVTKELVDIDTIPAGIPESVENITDVASKVEVELPDETLLINPPTEAEESGSAEKAQTLAAEAAVTVVAAETMAFSVQTEAPEDGPVFKDVEIGQAPAISQGVDVKSEARIIPVDTDLPNIAETKEGSHVGQEERADQLLLEVKPQPEISDHETEFRIIQPPTIDPTIVTEVSTLDIRHPVNVDPGCLQPTVSTSAPPKDLVDTENFPIVDESLVVAIDDPLAEAKFGSSVEVESEIIEAVMSDHEVRPTETEAEAVNLGTFATLQPSSSVIIEMAAAQYETLPRGSNAAVVVADGAQATQSEVTSVVLDADARIPLEDVIVVQEERPVGILTGPEIPRPSVTKDAEVGLVTEGDCLPESNVPESIFSAPTEPPITEDISSTHVDYQDYGHEAKSAFGESEKRCMVEQNDTPSDLHDQVTQEDPSITAGYDSEQPWMPSSDFVTRGPAELEPVVDTSIADLNQLVPPPATVHEVRLDIKATAVPDETPANLTSSREKIAAGLEVPNDTPTETPGSVLAIQDNESEVVHAPESLHVEMEYPGPTWTSSYNVTTQTQEPDVNGSTPLQEASVSYPEDNTEALLLEADRGIPAEIQQENTTVVEVNLRSIGLDDPYLVLRNLEGPLTDLLARTHSDVDRPKSPWTPSYSVTVQGLETPAPAAKDENVEEKHLSLPIPEEPAVELNVEFPAKESTPDLVQPDLAELGDEGASIGRSKLELESEELEIVTHSVVEVPKTLGDHEISPESGNKAMIAESGEPSAPSLLATRDEPAGGMTLPSKLDEPGPSTRPLVLPLAPVNEASNADDISIPVSPSSPTTRRNRLESTASSLIFHGDWFSPTGRTSVEIAQGEFTPPKSPIELPPPPPTPHTGFEDRNKNRRSCIVM